MRDWLINDYDFDLEQNKTFFGPYSDFIGAAIPLPGAIKAVSDSLDKQTLPLYDALQKIKKVMGGLSRDELGIPTNASGPVKLILLQGEAGGGNGMILLRLGKNESVIHMFRLIQFRVP